MSARAEKEVTRNYEEAFKKYVGGTISPNQNWGFDEDVAQARALTRTANPNANMWGETWEVPETLTTAQKKRVRLYFQYNKTPQNEPIDYKNFWRSSVVFKNLPDMWTTVNKLTKQVAELQAQIEELKGNK